MLTTITTILDAAIRIWREWLNIGGISAEQRLIVGRAAVREINQCLTALRNINPNCRQI